MTDMILVQGGEFRMGDTENLLLKNTRPVHTVKVSSFYIAKYPVSRTEWKALIPGRQDERRSGNEPDPDTRPVTMVSWIDVAIYCNLLSTQEGFPLCYDINDTTISCEFRNNGYRLPTEAEWEYAARGGRHSNNFIYAGSDNIDAVGWYKGNSTHSTHKRGEKLPNELGVYDMSGNVWEWCWDRYGNYSVEDSTDPLGPNEGQRRVYRGGSWVDFEYACTVAARGARPASCGYDDIGFRLVRSAEPVCFT